MYIPEAADLLRRITSRQVRGRPGPSPGPLGCSVELMATTAAEMDAVIDDCAIAATAISERPPGPTATADDSAPSCDVCTEIADANEL